jgi:SAM-dependent methyltransferase
VTFVDLGMSPLCETFLLPEELSRMEAFYPLRVFVCERCFLVQLEEFVDPDGIFAQDYRYFSSYSESWLRHAEAYATMIVDRLGLGRESLVVELGSNDGYLLQYVRALGVPVLGIEPARNIAAVANERGIPTRSVFFGADTARDLRAEGISADLIVGNNVLAQVPDLNGFVAGVKTLLRPGGMLTFEFPHLERLVAENQFDTIYHEHFSYFSFTTVREIFGAHGLDIVDVEELPTHGGSLRIFGRHAGERAPTETERCRRLAAHEVEVGMRSTAYYAAFAGHVESAKRALLRFLIDAKEQGKRVVGYGAPGKGNTLLNTCGIRSDLLEYTVDRNEHKHGRFTPGTHIPIHPPDRIFQTRPDYVLILPWNLKDEIVSQMEAIRDWGGRFVVPIPALEVLP